VNEERLSAYRISETVAVRTLHGKFEARSGKVRMYTSIIKDSRCDAAK
jgi:hypothetical protein